MKNKALKHYKRKKFFYRFFMLKAPRSGVILKKIHGDIGKIAPKKIIHASPNIAPDRGDFRIKKR